MCTAHVYAVVSGCSRLCVMGQVPSPGFFDKSFIPFPLPLFFLRCGNFAPAPFADFAHHGCPPAPRPPPRTTPPHRAPLWLLNTASTLKHPISVASVVMVFYQLALFRLTFPLKRRVGATTSNSGVFALPDQSCMPCRLGPSLRGLGGWPVFAFRTRFLRLQGLTQIRCRFP